MVVAAKIRMYVSLAKGIDDLIENGAEAQARGWFTLAKKGCSPVLIYSTNKYGCVILIVFHCSSDYVCISPLYMGLVVFIGVFYYPFRYRELYCVLDELSLASFEEIYHIYRISICILPSLYHELS